MNALLAKKRLQNRFMAMISLCIIAFFFFGCGSELTGDLGVADPGSEALSPASPVPDEEGSAENNYRTNEDVISSDFYAGYLVVHLDEELSSKENERNEVLSQIKSILGDFKSSKLRRFFETDEGVLDKRRQELEGASGTKLPDLNLIYRIDTGDANEAVAIYRSFQNKSGIKYFYPDQKLSAYSLAGTPDLTTEQGYLYPETTHGGLNAQAAWAAGITGQGVVLVDGENDWNLDHEDIAMSWGKLIGERVCGPGMTGLICLDEYNHGTAMLGIMGAIPNGHGVTGMAYGADIHPMDYSGGYLIDMIDGVGDTVMQEFPPGTVLGIFVGPMGALRDPNRPNYGGLPTEARSAERAAIMYAIAAGVTVVEAAGNGWIDIGRSDAYLPNQVNPTDVDSGAIMTSGSWGINHNHARPQELNCGTRVNAFAWGSGVATAGYKYDGNPYQWIPGAGAPVPPNDSVNTYFINNTGGTSTATAMVASAAALVQSYFKRESGVPATRYLMPLKMREILVNSGVPQTGGGCNIGKQPRVDVAMGLVDGLLANINSQYPELANKTPLTHERMLQLRQADGIGIVCKKMNATTHALPEGSDPSCPEVDLWPTGNVIAKDLDFDGDGRADLVQWTAGQWKLDLSSKGTTADNFGAWDVIINYPPIPGEWVWPYVSDMNSDGREDFVVYDKEHGRFYIKFISGYLLATGNHESFDLVIDYSSEWTDTLTMDPFGTDPNIPDSRYSRPAIGDYNGDGWNDIAIACSDGIWRIDFGNGTAAGFAGFEQRIQYLTPAQLAAAPGWAYLSFTFKFQGSGRTLLQFRVPDSLQEEGRLIAFDSRDPSYDWMAAEGRIFGKNNQVLLPGWYNGENYSSGYGLKDDEDWLISLFDEHNGVQFPFTSVSPSSVYGDISCHPIAADFDGDRKTDRAVMCPDRWRIAYSDSNFAQGLKSGDGLREVQLGYDANTFSLPGRSYAGGVTYSSVKQLIELFRLSYPNLPPPIPVDMVTVGQ